MKYCDTLAKQVWFSGANWIKFETLFLESDIDKSY